MTITRATGNGVTPKNLVKQINKKLASGMSLNALARATGVNVAALHRYKSGIGEPTTASLQKLADYFKVSVAWLRDEDIVSVLETSLDIWKKDFVSLVGTDFDDILPKEVKNNYWAEMHFNMVIDGLLGTNIDLIHPTYCLASSIKETCHTDINPKLGLRLQQKAVQVIDIYNNLLKLKT